MNCAVLTASPSLLSWAHHLGALDANAAGVCKATVQRGDIHLLEYLMTIAEDCPSIKYQLYYDTCRQAAACGALNVLQWARDQDFKFAWSHTCDSAALGGHLEVLQWAVKHGQQIFNAARFAP